MDDFMSLFKNKRFIMLQCFKTEYLIEIGTTAVITSIVLALFVCYLVKITLTRCNRCKKSI